MIAMERKRLGQTSGGCVVKDWELKKLGECANIYRGGSPRPIENYITEDINGLNWIKIGDVEPASKYIYSTEERIKKSGISSTKLVYEGDLLLSNSMSFGRPYILKLDGAIHDGWLVIQDYKKTFDVDFLYYALSSELTFAQYKTFAAGSSVLNLNKDVVKDVFIYTPSSLAEQERIASALTAADNLIAALDKQIAKTRNLKQATMQHLLSSLPNHSPLKPLGEVCEFTRGQGMSKQDRGGGNIPIILYGELYTTYGNYINEVVSKASQDVVQSSPIIKKGDLLLPISSTTKEAQIGKVSAYCCDYKAYLGGDAIMLKHKQIPGYLVHLLNSPWFERKKMPHAKGITINHLDPKGLSEIKIPIPAIEQQQFIAEVLLSMDNQIAALEKKRSKYEMVKQGMMQQLLTGTIRLI